MFESAVQDDHYYLHVELQYTNIVDYGSKATLHTRQNAVDKKDIERNALLI